MVIFHSLIGKPSNFLWAIEKKHGELLVITRLGNCEARPRIAILVNCHHFQLYPYLGKS